MTESSLQSQIDAAQAYESLFVPALFGQWTKDMVNAAQLKAGQKVLDIACGTGVLARAIATHTSPGGYVAAIDPNPGMLTVAREFRPDIDWREGMAENLPFLDRSFDAVLSQFGLMFFQDRAQSLREMLRVLKSPGRLVVAVWDSIENIPGYSTQLGLIERMAGQAAAEASRAPFILGNRDDLVALFQEAGATSVDVTTQRGTARFPSIQVMVEAELSGWLPVMGVNLAEELVHEILREAESALGSYATPDGTMIFDVTAHVVTAQKS